MIQTPSSQLSIDSFVDSAIGRLNPKNRWVLLASSIPWSHLGVIYESKMSQNKGARAKSSRLVIGALIIKHKLKLSDQETIEQIQENPYLQYFVGLPKFTFDRPFDPSLFPRIRKRLSTNDFNKMTQALQDFEIEINEKGEEEEHVKVSEENVIVVDATVAPQEIPYPTDHKLLASARTQSEIIIDQLWRVYPDKRITKPRTYRKKAHKEFVTASKKRKKGKEFWLEVSEQQLRYLERNLSHIHSLLDGIEGGIPLNNKHFKMLHVIHEVARQQREKLNSGTNTIANRIINVFQPHVRPIKRGKDNAETEFGAKISISIDQGYTYLDKASWENYYEGKSDIVLESIESYNKRHPEDVLKGFVGDKLYGNKPAREAMKNQGVEFIGSPLGRPPKALDKVLEREKNQKVHQKLRSSVEGKIGQSKRAYGLDKIKARKSDTALSWIACVLFVTNLQRFWKGIFFDLIFTLIQYNLWEIEKNESPINTKIGE